MIRVFIGDLKLCCRCGTKLDEPEDSRLVEIARSKPVELHHNTRVWIDVVGDISPHSDEANKGQPVFLFTPFEEVQLNLTYKPNDSDSDDVTARFLFCPEPRGGDHEPICVLNATFKRPICSEVYYYYYSFSSNADLFNKISIL